MAFKGNNVYIIGAGFSRAAGMPLMTEFYEKMRDAATLNDNVSASGKEAIKTIQKARADLTAVREKLNMNLDDIEELLSLIDAAYPAERGDTSSVSISVRKAISATLCSYERPARNITVTGNPSDPGSWNRLLPTGGYVAPNQSAVDPYDYFAELITRNLDPEFKENETDTVISFNYDFILEKALERIGRAFEYGIEGMRWDGPRTLEDSPLVIIKLHGSINWYQQDGGLCVAADPQELIDGPGRYPLLAPPTWNKSSPVGVLPQLWSRAREAISKATRIVVIGYSMPKTDPYFKYLLAAGLKDNHDLQKLCVINPQNLDQIYRDFLDQTFFSSHRREDRPMEFERFLASSRDVFVTIGRGKLLVS